MFPRAALVILGAVLLTIATVVVVAAVRIRHGEESGKHVRVATDISVFHSQLEVYRTTTGSLPSTEQGLRALVQKPTGSPIPAQWHELLGDIPPDPWNTAYVYRCPGLKNPNGYDLFSAGPDRKPYTADDDWGR
jgi:general secretion pathway protein G